MDLVEKTNEISFFFFSLLDEEKERVKKMSKIVQVGDAVDHEDDVYSLLFVVVLSGASVSSNSSPSTET
jgi:hypothetical protein